MKQVSKLGFPKVVIGGDHCSISGHRSECVLDMRGTRRVTD